MFPAIEGFGINVMQMAKTGRISYYNGPNTVTYFSIIFFRTDRKNSSRQDTIQTAGTL
jgi:hypothetical protein